VNTKKKDATVQNSVPTNIQPSGKTKYPSKAYPRFYAGMTVSDAKKIGANFRSSRGNLQAKLPRRKTSAFSATGKLNAKQVIGIIYEFSWEVHFPNNYSIDEIKSILIKKYGSSSSQSALQPQRGGSPAKQSLCWGSCAKGYGANVIASHTQKSGETLSILIQEGNSNGTLVRYSVTNNAARALFENHENQQAQKKQQEVDSNKKKGLKTVNDML